jgi:hypothetical protein
MHVRAHQNADMPTLTKTFFYYSPLFSPALLQHLHYILYNLNLSFIHQYLFATIPLLVLRRRILIPLLHEIAIVHPTVFSSIPISLQFDRYS